jgi:hypothetical protein
MEYSASFYCFYFACVVIIHGVKTLVSELMSDKKMSLIYSDTFVILCLNYDGAKDCYV